MEKFRNPTGGTIADNTAICQITLQQFSVQKESNSTVNPWTPQIGLNDYIDSYYITEPLFITVSLSLVQSVDQYICLTISASIDLHLFGTVCTYHFSQLYFLRCSTGFTLRHTLYLTILYSPSYIYLACGWQINL